MPRPKRAPMPTGPALLFCLTTALAPAALAGVADDAPAPAAGLIVRLRQATPHGAAQARPADAARWERVLGDAALSGRSGRRPPALRAVGRDQQWLDFGRLLSADESARLAARLRRQPQVEWVTPNVRERALQVPTDPLYMQQWWLMPARGSNANAIADRLRGVPGFQRAWLSGLAGATGSAATVVAVLDTGVTPHPELIGRTLPGYDFVSDGAYGNDGDGRDADPSDPGDWISDADKALDPGHFSSCDTAKSSWHGTIITGLIAAATDNGIGVAGIDRQARVLPVRVAGKCGASVADIVDGMRWAAGLPVPGAPPNTHPARILNISFGGSGSCDGAYATALHELTQLGVVVVAAAGNEHGVPTRPARCDGVVGVAALNRDGFKSHYSNFGPELAALGIATVGGDDNRGGAWGTLLADTGLVGIWNNGSTSPAGADYAALFGTSFAAPLVAGTMGLMLAVNPALSAAQLIDGVRRSARPHVVSPQIGLCSSDNPGRCICSTATCGAGILDAEQALLFASHPDSYVAPARQPEIIDTPETVQAAALGPDRPPNAATAAGATGGGGGALAPIWVLALGAAVLALRRPLRSARRRP